MSRSDAGPNKGYGTPRFKRWSIWGLQLDTDPRYPAKVLTTDILAQHFTRHRQSCPGRRRKRNRPDRQGAHPPEIVNAPKSDDLYTGIAKSIAPR